MHGCAGAASLPRQVLLLPPDVLGKIASLFFNDQTGAIARSSITACREVSVETRQIIDAALTRRLKPGFSPASPVDFIQNGQTRAFLRCL